MLTTLSSTLPPWPLRLRSTLSWRLLSARLRREVKIRMGPGEPSITTGVMTNSMDLGGRFLRQSYQGDAVEGPFPSFAGRGYWGYNKGIIQLTRHLQSEYRLPDRLAYDSGH